MKLLALLLLWATVLGSHIDDVYIKRKAAFIERGIDQNVEPCDDFWAYANGGIDIDSLQAEVEVEAERILSTPNPRYTDTALASVQHEYRKCIKNPWKFFFELQNEPSGQRDDIIAFSKKIQDGEAIANNETFLELLQEAYRLHFDYGSDMFKDFNEILIRDTLIFDYQPLGEREAALDDTLVDLKNVTDEQQFLAGVFGADFDSSQMVAVGIAFPNETEIPLRRLLLSELSSALWKTLAIPHYRSCVDYIIDVFPMYYAKMLVDSWGRENITQANSQFLADMKMIVETAETSLRFGNVLSQNMSETMLKRVANNQFFGLDHPIYEDKMFYEFFGNITLRSPVQSRWINKWRPLIQAAQGRNLTFLLVPEVVFNAYHISPTERTVIFFPILKPLFFHPSFPSALRFSGTGGVVGHEFGHDFDSSLRRLVPLDSTYTQIYDCLRQYYSGQCDPEDPSTCVDPELTLGENFADVFGIQMAYLAYKRDVAINGGGQHLQGTILEKLSDDKIFFINLAQAFSIFGGWRGYDSYGDPHSPGPARVWGALAGLKAFSNAFNCPTGSKYRQEGCVLYNDKIEPDFNLTYVGQ
ncbi:unnamed protein product [Bursaphelenchus xylophilus]|uniref:(pine wood nematode) hypothetical protein n=1 Tax=Bursaphelenchus xylophilus TaxID=6326 RepID=A0A1I7RU94_BURXY|nr:unnamed protein product [Bursaphelenchus xylophilus]CAG9113947.1 unnamed protein product [Bursaphelenchus xylophilus]